MKNKLSIFYIILFLMLISLACSFPFEGQNDEGVIVATTVAQTIEAKQSGQQEIVDPVLPQETPEAPVELAVVTEDPYPELILPFSENFDGGLRQEWRVLGSQQPIFIYSKLTAIDSGIVSLEIGNSKLKDYIIEFDADCNDKNGWISFYFNPSFYLEITPRYSNKSDLVWGEFHDDKWQSVSALRSDVLTKCRPQRVQISRSGDYYEIYLDGALAHTIKYGSTFGSPLIIQISDSDITIDNLIIK